MLHIGSGDVLALLSGTHTETHKKLWRKFFDNDPIRYNAKASPIDACRAGAILEDRFMLNLDDSYFPQFKCISKDMNVLSCSIDFGKIEEGKLVDFIELKTLNFDSFLQIEDKRNTTDISFIKKGKFKAYYNQIQEQLYCTELESCEICFLVVYTYDDEVNYKRVINDNEYMKFRIRRDDEVIRSIIERAQLFQLVKNSVTK